MKDVRLLLQLTQAMKIVWFTPSLPDALRQSSPKPRLRHRRRLAPLSRPNLTLNFCTFFFVVLLVALLSRLPYLLTSPTVPLAGKWLRSSLIIWDLTFLSPSQRSSIAKPEATFLSSAEPHALRSLTRPFAPPSPPLNFLWLPQTFPPPLPLVQTKLPIPR